MQPSEPMASSAFGALVGETTEAVTALAGLIDRETDLLRAGRTAAGMALGAKKALAAARYADLLKQVRGEVAAHRSAWSAALADLRQRHASLETRLAVNLAVLTTLGSVSESILKDVSQRVAAQAAPRIYGPPGAPARPPGTAPISLSRIS